MVYGKGYSDADCCEITKNGKPTKEYETWRGIIRRCSHLEKDLERHPEYKDVNICEEWLHFKNFMTWLQSQPNYDKWKIGGRSWTIDKDIIHKGNKIYSPDNCCLVPNNVNVLFTNRKNHRGTPAPGVNYAKWMNRYRAAVNNPLLCKTVQLGSYKTLQEAFEVYKKTKEIIIKSVAEIEYALGNISKKCYDAMLKYEIKITD